MIYHFTLYKNDNYLYFLIFLKYRFFYTELLLISFKQRNFKPITTYCSLSNKVIKLFYLVVWLALISDARAR
jgi:hypothetical protein